PSTTAELIPVQKVHDTVEFNIAHYNQPENRQAVEDTFFAPFDLAKAPLLRVAVVETTTETGPGGGAHAEDIDRGERYMMLDMHHIISDGTSMDVLIKEFFALYEGETLPPLKLQYRDYAEWQGAGKKTQLIKRQQEFWINEFSGELPILELPLDYPRPAVQSHEGKRVEFLLNRKETQKFKEIARKENPTLYMAILAVFTIMLAKLSRQEDIIIGTPTAGRRHTDIENTIGIFLNTLAMRNYPTGEKTFRRYLIEVKERTLQAYENQEYQFEDLVDMVSIIRDPGRNPLFDILLNLLNTTTPAHGDGDTTNHEEKDYRHKAAVSKFDINVTASENAGAIHFKLAYSTALFKEKTIERIIGYFKKIVKTVSANPDIKIATIDLIPETTKKEILNRFNRNLRDETVINPIQDKLTRTFRKYPDHIAIRYGATELTYRQLENKTAAISNRIIQHQIPKGSFIGIYMEDRQEIIAAILGILYAGCAFVSLDTTQPAGRLEKMIRNIDTPLILTDGISEKKITHLAAGAGEDSDTREKAPGGAHGTSHKKTIRHQVINPSFYRRHETRHEKIKPLKNQMESAVYVFFTSGTTGMPKAVIGKNRALTQFIQWEVETFDVAPSYHVSQLINVGFDPYLRDVFTPLTAGATICIPHDNQLIFEREKLA
ncbi:MAG: AMP-binding protein, partial [bacterium]|nr:AMP-binding protein [bacterium]